MATEETVFLDQKSLNFNGSDEYITVADDASLDITDQLSVFMWVKTTGINQGLTSKYNNTTSERSWSFSLNGSGVLTGNFSSDGGFTTPTNAVSVTGATAVNDGNWHHVGFTFNAGTVTFYVDGVSDGSGNMTVATTLFSNSRQVYIGAIEQSAAAFNHLTGSMTEYAIWDGSILSSSEVTTLYNNGKPIQLDRNCGLYTSSADLVSWYRMGEFITATTMPDQVGANDGTLNNMDQTNCGLDTPELTIKGAGNGTDNRIMRWDGGETAQDSLLSIDDSGNLLLVTDGGANIGATASGRPDEVHIKTAIKLRSLDVYPDAAIIDQKSLVFNGTDEYIRVADNNSLDISDELSVFLWIKTTATAGTAVAKYDAGASKRSWSLSVNGSGQLSGNFSSDGGFTTPTNAISVASTGTINDGEWHHVGFTFIAGTIQFYIDGATDGSGNFTVATTLFTSDMDMMFGCVLQNDVPSASFWDGSLSDCAMWDTTALTASEVTALYNGGVPTDVRKDCGNYSSSADLVGYWRLGESTTTTTQVDLAGTSNGVLGNMDLSNCAYDAPAASSGGAASSGVVNAVQLSDGAGGFKDDGANLFWDDTNDRLGIGTATPVSSLEVASAGAVNARIQVSSAGNYGLLYLNGQQTAGSSGFAEMDFQNAGQSNVRLSARRVDANNSYLTFAVRSTADGLADRMTISKEGRVGIGTSTPAEELDMLATVDTALTFKMKNTFTNRACNIEMDGNRSTATNPFAGTFFYNNSNYVGYISCNTGGAQDEAYMEFGTRDTADGGAVARMIIAQDGNVGIHEASPDEYLHITTTDATRPAIKLETTSTSSAGGRLVFDTNRSVAGGNISAMEGLWNGTQVAEIAIITGADNTNKDDGRIGFFTKESSPGTLTEKVRIESDGKVGIGTITPDVLAHINAASGPAEMTLETEDANSYAFLQLKGTRTSGGVGVGYVRGINDNNIIGDIIFVRGSTSLAGQLYFGVSNAAGSFATAMIIDEDGSVGIGTTSPDAFVEVEKLNDSAAVSMFINNSSATSNAGAYGELRIGRSTAPADGVNIGLLWFGVKGSQVSAGVTGVRDGASPGGKLKFWSTTTGGSNTERWNIGNDGHFRAAVDNTYDIGASAANRPRDLHIGRNITAAGGLRLNRTAVADSDYTILTSDYYIGVSSLTVTRTLTLPTAASAGDGKIFVIKDESGSASGSVKITIDGDGAETIDGVATYDIDLAYDSITLMCSGTAWFIV